MSLINEPKAWKTVINPDTGESEQRLITEVAQIEGTLKPQGLDLGGKITIISLDATTWKAMPTIGLTDRKNIALQNQSGNGNVILYNYINTGSEGWHIEDGGFKSVLLDRDVQVYCKMLSGAGSICVDEVA